MQQLKIGRALTDRYRTYAAVTNQSFDAVLQHALDDWMDTIGEGHIELITGCAMDSEAQRLGLPVEPCAPSTILLH
jgi:hypothetical protein